MKTNSRGDVTQLLLDWSKGDQSALNEAMERLAILDPRQAEIIDMRFFGGLTNDEIADALKIPLATVEREAQAAKAWLRSQLE